MAWYVSFTHSPVTTSGISRRRAGQRSCVARQRSCRAGQRSCRAGQRSYRAGQRSCRARQCSCRTGQRSCRDGQRSCWAGQRSCRAGQRRAELDNARAGVNTRGRLDSVSFRGTHICKERRTHIVCSTNRVAHRIILSRILPNYLKVTSMYYMQICPECSYTGNSTHNRSK